MTYFNFKKVVASLVLGLKYASTSLRRIIPTMVPQTSYFLKISHETQTKP